MMEQLERFLLVASGDELTGAAHLHCPYFLHSTAHPTNAIFSSLGDVSAAGWP